MKMGATWERRGPDCKAYGWQGYFMGFACMCWNFWTVYNCNGPDMWEF